MSRLKGKICLITGAGSGIGRASARLFAREGANVVVADVDDRGAKATVSQIRKAGGLAAAEHVDVTDEADTVALVARVVKRLKRIDVLFNNAGISGVGDVLETEPKVEQELFQFENVIVTPHVAWFSVEASEKLRRTAITDILRILSGHPALYPVPQ